MTSLDHDALSQPPAKTLSVFLHPLSSPTSLHLESWWFLQTQTLLGCSVLESVDGWEKWDPGTNGAPKGQGGMDGGGEAEQHREGCGK